MHNRHQRLIIGLLKAGQEVVEKKKKKQKILLREAYPDYGKSLVTREREDPTTAGLRRASGTGITGAIIGTLLARILTKDPTKILAGAAIGGATGAIPGYISGRDEALSNYSKLLFLRRLGLGSLGELSASENIPGAWRKTLVKGETV